MNTGTIVLVLGVGAAAFLYWRSQQAQAAALAAAAASPEAGALQKTWNTIKPVVKAVPTTVKAAITAPVGAVSGLIGLGGKSISFAELVTRAKEGKI